MGKTIYKMIISQQGEREKSKKIVFVIMTDGLENASCEYTYLTVKRLIENQKKIGWEFFFLGANVDAVREAANIGISSDRSVTFHNNSAGIALNYEVIGETWDNFVTVFFRKKETASQPWQVIAQRFCSIGIWLQYRSCCYRRDMNRMSKNSLNIAIIVNA